MKMMQASLILMAFGLFGCGDRKPRSFFASDGISIGVPVMVSAVERQLKLPPDDN
jgi:hypothetical protein